MVTKRQKNSKLYRGAYQYERNGNVYLEETFEVFKDKKSLTYEFESHILSRVSTGELLRVTINYFINKSFIPQLVKIHRELGDETIDEIYKFDSRKNMLTYQFINEAKDINEVKKFQVNAKFFITTPAACTSLLYIKSKKLDANSKNFYNIYSSSNEWTFEDIPQQRMLALERVSASPVNITIAGSTLKGLHYKIYDTEESESGSADQIERSIINSYASEHLTIPYLIEDDNGTKVKIKYLNDLSQGGDQD